jgi:hypothetical protein
VCELGIGRLPWARGRFKFNCFNFPVCSETASVFTRTRDHGLSDFATPDITVTEEHVVSQRGKPAGEASGKPAGTI